MANSSFIKHILDLILPCFCIGCGKLGTHICPQCLIKKTESWRARCAICGKSSLYGLTHPSCAKKNAIDGVFSLYRYDGLIRKLIRLMKYGGAYRITEDLQKSIHPEIQQTLTGLFSIWKPDMIVPVPLHMKKERSRGFNQAELLCVFLTDLLDLTIPIETDLIRRTRFTKPQSEHPSHHDRAKNIADAFALIQPASTISQKTILLVDDIWTSGATAKEITKLLKYNGASTVYIFTIAHG